MGGTGSGRSGGRPTTDSGLTLDVGRLLRQRTLVPGATCTGILIWTNSYTGKRSASLGYESHLGEEDGRLRLHYTTTRWTDEKHYSDYWVTLRTTLQPFGGRRWWFVCPRSGQLCAKLYLPAGALTFASRRAYRLGYRSQRETSYDRAINRAFKLRRRLGAEGGIGDYIVKPKGMRWTTYEREMVRVAAAETICDANLISFARKLGLKV